MIGPPKRQARIARGEVADELSRRLRVAKASAPSDARDAENARVRSLPIGDPYVLKGETADLLGPEPRVRAFRRVLSDPQKIRQNRMNDVAAGAFHATDSGMLGGHDAAT